MKLLADFKRQNLKHFRTKLREQAWEGHLSQHCTFPYPTCLSGHSPWHGSGGTTDFPTPLVNCLSCLLRDTIRACCDCGVYYFSKPLCMGTAYYHQVFACFQILSSFTIIVHWCIFLPPSFSSPFSSSLPPSFLSGLIF